VNAARRIATLDHLAQCGESSPLVLTCYYRHMKVPVLPEQQFVTDAKGRRVAVLLDLKTYGRLIDAEEELADIRAYDAARPKALAELKAGQFSTLADYRAKRSKGQDVGLASIAVVNAKGAYRILSA